MGNTIKRSGEGLALQITEAARNAGLVEENNEGDVTFLADVRVYAFDDLLLVVAHTTDRLTTADVADLVTSASRDTTSIYRAMDASIQRAGNGYQVQLPPARDAGFTEGHATTVQTAPEILIICRDRSKRLAADLVTIRHGQVNAQMTHGNTA